MDTRPQRATPIETSTPVAHGCDSDPIPAEHFGTVRALIAWLRDEAPIPWHPVGFLGSLPGWDEYAGEEITARGWALVLERELRASLPGALASILHTAADHDACVSALQDAARAADETAFEGVDHRGVCTWVSTGAYRAFISHTGPERTLWTIAGGAAVQLVALGQSEAA